MSYVQLLTALAVLLLSAPVWAQSESVVEAKPPDPKVERAIRPDRVSAQSTASVDWKALTNQSLLFLGVKHAFRWATEPGTREMRGPFFSQFYNSINSLHGWGDGDPFYVNYVGHPMQGAVAGYIWAQNDGAYRTVEFGKNRHYWRSRLRATAFSWAYSAQFEIGPISEASIGYIQSKPPAQGFVDHVATPTLGFAWMVAEDAIDKYLIRRFEDRFENPWARLLVRGGLNPARGFANLMALRVPWYRDNRAGVLSYVRGTKPVEPEIQLKPRPEHAPFELTALARLDRFAGLGLERSCIGGGVEAAFRHTPRWQTILHVSGCQHSGFARNFSGDALTYAMGQRWNLWPGRRWNSYVQFLIGGNKITHEELLPSVKASLEAAARSKGAPPPRRSDYSRVAVSNALWLQGSVGVEYRLNAALALRPMSVAYTQAWNRPVNGNLYQDGLQFTSGIVLRMGSW